jgi:hypothetical protein
MTRKSRTLVALLTSLALSGCIYLTPASVTSGTKNFGNGFSSGPAISTTGRYTAFVSTSSNLVANDNNVLADVFVHDNQTNATTRVSVSSNGTEANGASAHPAISADGRFVAFESTATNLVANDTNNVSDVFVRDRQGGTTTRVSVSPSDGQGDDASSHPSITADGSIVAFASLATNLSGRSFGTTQGRSHIYVRRWGANPTTRVVSGAGCILLTSEFIEEDGPSVDPAISGDGSVVAFGSSADDLVANDTNAAPDVFVSPAFQTCLNWHTDIVDADTNGSNFNSAGIAPTISFDGRFVAYRGWVGTPNLVRIMRRDRSNAADAFFDTSSFPGNHTFLSDDGTKLAFTAQAGGGLYRAYVHDYGTGSNTLVSTDDKLNPVNTSGDADMQAALSGNGDYAAWVRDDSQVLTRYVTVPTLAAVSPATVAHGTTGTFWITGTNFRPGTRVISTNTNVAIGTVTYFSPTLLLAGYAVNSQAPMGTKTTIVVALPDGFAPATSATAQCNSCVSVS